MPLPQKPPTPYDDRYDPKNRQLLARFSRDLVGGLCCFPGCEAQGTEDHHAMYAIQRENRLVPIVGRETPGVHTFWLCDRHHKERTDPDCAHHWSNWLAGSGAPPKLDARQRRGYYRKLLAGWREKYDRAHSGLKTSP